jgi:hypothetical protein
MRKGTGTVHEDQDAFIIRISLIFLRMRNVSEQSCGENKSTRFTFTNPFFRKSYRLRDKNIVQPDRPQMTVRPTRIACWIPKATNSLSEYVILTAFPPQQWSHERASVLRCTYIASLVFFFYAWTIILDLNCNMICMTYVLYGSTRLGNIC